MYEFNFTLDRLHPLLKLSFFQHMHHFHSTEDLFGCSKRFKPKHGTDSLLDKAMILLYYVIQVLLLSKLHTIRYAFVFFQLFNCYRISRILIDCYNTMLTK